MKVGAPLVEFAEGTEQDTGTIVGELQQRRSTPARQASLPSDRPDEAAVRCFRRFARSRANSMSILTRRRPRVPAAPSRGPTSNGLRKSLSEAGPAEALRGMRRAMAQRMTAAHAEIVPATVTDEADIDDWRQGEDATIRLVRAIAAACKAEPALNAWYNSVPARRRLIARVDHWHRRRYRGRPHRSRVAQCRRARAHRTCAPDLTGCGLTPSRARFPRRSCAARPLRCRISA